MAQQWGAGQPGFQYTLQTGLPVNNPQLQQQYGGGLAAQPTGFPGQRPGFQPQPTGYGQLQAQPTGYLPQFQQRLPPPPVPPLPSNLGGGFRPNPQPSFLSAQPTQVQPPNRFLSASPAQSPGLLSNPTGYAGGGLLPQQTGFVDPRLQMMAGTFLPANPAAALNPSGPLQFAGGLSNPGQLQQSIQQYNQSRGSTTNKLPWALSKQEKKSFDQIFRAWDVQGSGFISGQMALEVFGMSGLSQNDLAKIWALADADNRGKLNLAEFHVAMGLIYRRLNGNDVPDVLPPELVPPSSRDLDDSVNFVRDILKNDTSRSSSISRDDTSQSRMRVRSFNDAPVGAGGRKDGTVFRYNEDNDSGQYYQSRARHIDRNTVRTGNESPSNDLSDLKRQLENASKALDAATDEAQSRTAEDDALDREMEDLRYRIKRLQDDLDYVSRGPRSASKDDERRRLQRDLMHLLHQRLPEVEKKIEEREKRKEREKREWNRERDRRNDRFGRYDDREAKRDEDRYGSFRDRDEDRDDRYRRDSYDRENKSDRDYGRDRGYNNRDRSPDRDRDDRSYNDRDGGRGYDSRRGQQPDARSPPPPPPPAEPAQSRPPPAAPPKPVSSPAPTPNLKSMTREEREAYIREQAARRLEERKRALGVVSPATPASPTIDSTINDRLAQDKKEAEEKARAAERDAEERERLRKQRVDEERAQRNPTPSPVPPTTASRPTPVAPPAPPAPKARAPAPPAPPPAIKYQPPAPVKAPPPVAPKRNAPPQPPPSRKFASAPARPVAPVAPPTIRAPVTPVAPPMREEEDAEEKMLREREERFKKAQEARAKRLRLLELEEAEAKQAEEEFERRQALLRSAPKASQVPISPPTLTVDVSPPPPPPPPPAPPAPKVVAPPAPPAPAPPALSGTSTVGSSTNPFSRLANQGAGVNGTPTPPTAGGSGTNPFFRPQPATITPPVPVIVPPPVSSGTPTSRSPPPVKTSYHTVPAQDDDEDWDDIKENDDDDSSDDGVTSSRDKRNQLAQQLFSNVIPARPQSAAGEKSTTPAPLTPGPLSAPPTAPPPPPAAPFAPPAPVAPFAAPAPAPGDRNALLGSILAGKSLRKAVTNDRSGSSLSGKVIGDIAPPPHISTVPRSPSPPPAPQQDTSLQPGLVPMSRESSYRQSVDWYAGLAAEGASIPTAHLPPTDEDKEEEEVFHSAVPDIIVNQNEGDVNDATADVDHSTEYRVRTLYAYEGQKGDDLTFPENAVLTAHPSKSGGDWWYGTIVKDGRSGFFPSTYVQRLESTQAKALYSYNGSTPEEDSFEENDVLTIVDRSEPDWWKTEKMGTLLIVPASYLEILEGLDERQRPSTIPSNPVTDSTISNGGKFWRQELSPAREETISVIPPSPRPRTLDMHKDKDESSDDDEYHSCDSDSESQSDSDQEETEESRKLDRKARSIERQRVLEAAGLIVKKVDEDESSRAVRKRSIRGHRPPPAIPQRQSLTLESLTLDPNKALPATPSPPSAVESILHVDDAFQRYEAFRMRRESHNANRLSVSSIDTTPSLASPSIASTPSKDGENRTSTYSLFSNLFGRKTPAQDAEKPRPTISSPILSVETSVNEAAPAFGSSWASLVDRDALYEIPVKERRRQEAIFELINTESAYVHDLQLIVEVYYSSMLGLLDDKEITVIFANIEDILLMNTGFLSSLEERQKECRLYIDNIGDLIVKNMSNMGIYTQYCVNHGTAIKILQSLQAQKPELAAHLQKLREDPNVKNLGLSSYLLEPMQRITRYPLLIKQIMTHTEHPADRRDMELGLEKVQSVLNHINESIREQEGFARLKAISQTLWIGRGLLDLTEPTLYMGPRRLLKEGMLMKVKSSKKLQVILCNDIVVLVDEITTTLYRDPIPLNEVEVRDSSKGDDLAFRLVLSYPRGGDTINLKASSARDCDLWVKALFSAIRRCKEARKRVQGRR